ncbi:HIRAN domain-containing protein [Klenkia sp. LSe6-5]|uniref:HIRAN domain-containing protein n=1 Tax=Klenkia sesuvii TaxID=3103137 RepID=A0ABU8DX61_9ACTN
MSVDDLAAVPRAVETTSRRLLVTEKDADGFYRPVGFLGATVDVTSVEYTFDYLRSAVERAGFRPFLGFVDTGRTYRSEGLFPLFAERIMDPRRPEHPVFLASLDLTDDATPLEVLARSGGQRAGDGIMLLPEPAVDASGRTHCHFLVHGIRYLADAEPLLTRLRVGDRLVLRSEPENNTNPRALVVVESSGQKLGYVPDALLDYAHSVRERALTVVRVNGPEVGVRLRLLVRLDGHLYGSEVPFSGPAWQTMTDDRS